MHYSSNPRLNANLANPDQLENSYQVLNDEFWSNLLSTDSTDRINFTSNNFNGNTGNDEVFHEQLMSRVKKGKLVCEMIDSYSLYSLHLLKQNFKSFKTRSITVQVI